MILQEYYGRHLIENLQQLKRLVRAFTNRPPKTSACNEERSRIRYQAQQNVQDAIRVNSQCIAAGHLPKGRARYYFDESFSSEQLSDGATKFCGKPPAAMR